jgi:MFS family permease
MAEAAPKRPATWANALKGEQSDKYSKMLSDSSTHAAEAPVPQHAPEPLTTASDDAEWTEEELSSTLCWLNFFTIDRDRPGVFVGTYLLLLGWKEGQIGVVSFVKDIVSLFFQTPMGDIIDKTTAKREWICASDLILAGTCLLMMFFHNYPVVLACMAIQGIVLTVIPPALYGITLGMIGSQKLPEQSSMNETFKHGGSAVYALLAGIASYYGEDYWIFVMVILMGVVSMYLVMKIKPSMIDDDKARGLVPNKEGEKPLEAASYVSIFTNFSIMMFVFSVFLYHLANAAMLPLLSQVLAIDNASTGILMTAVNVVIAQTLFIPSALLVGKKAKTWGTKLLFVLGIIILPIRGAIIILCLHTGYTNAYAMASTQVLDGLSAGLYGVVCVLITEQLTRGSGRFNFVFGIVNTSNAVGGAFSNLIGQFIAQHYGYEAAFVSLSAVALFCLLIVVAFMPGANVSVMLKPDDDMGLFPESTHTTSGMRSSSHSKYSSSSHGLSPMSEEERRRAKQSLEMAPLASSINPMVSVAV